DQVKLMSKLGVYQPNLSKKEAWDVCDFEIKRRKATELDKADKIEREPVKVEYMEEDERPTLSPKPVSNGFHLTDENIRLGALDCAVKDLKGVSVGPEGFWERVRLFEKYIRFGE
ncbi:hypothetical protein LCGC14_1087980, partial [marine sediment metagenome]